MKLILAFLLLISIRVTGQNNITVFDINKTANANLSWSDPNKFTEFKDKLYFYATDGVHGMELWCIDSNGSPAMVADINPGSAGVRNFNNTAGVHDKEMAIIQENGTEMLYFIADDGIHGSEYFKYDGINPPVLAKDITPGPTTIFASNNHSVTIGNTLYIQCPNGSSWLSKYEPSSGTYTPVGKYKHVSSVNHIIAFRNKIYSDGSLLNGTSFWQYDLATDTMTLVDTVTKTPHHFMEMNGVLYFSASKKTSSAQLFSFDGINPPKPIAPHANYSYYHNNCIGKYNNKIYFTSPDANNHGQLAEYDPATGGVKQIATINPTDNAYCEYFVEYNGKLFFFARADSVKFNLYVYDGNNVSIACNNIRGHYLRGFKNNLYFNGGIDSFNTGKGKELCRFDPSKLSVQNLSFTGDVNLYPNPANTSCTISLDLKQPETITLSITDMAGKVVHQTEAKYYTTGNSQINIDMQNFAAGTYSYRLAGKDGGTLYSAKFIKQ